MNCGVILFIYNRPQCTKKVLESLKRNHVKELYVFQNGLSKDDKKTEWEETAEIIHKIDWCKVYFEQKSCVTGSVSEHIVDGINKVFEQKDEVIVIEDDCVVSDDCIEFMMKCFEVYRDNKKVIDIGAYLEPIKVPDNYKLSIIATGAPSGWGWGTWRDRWEEFKKDYRLIERIGNAMKNYNMFDSFGYDIKEFLCAYYRLRIWDTWWGINTLEKKGISIRPVFNKVYNIGFENPGLHTSGKSPLVVPINSQKKCIEYFPEEVEIEKWTEIEFKKFYESVSGEISLEERQIYYRNCLEKWVDFKQHGKNMGTILHKKNISKVAIYGTGTIGRLLINELDGKVKITYFIVSDKGKNEDIFGKYSIYDCDEYFPEEKGLSTLIVIPGYDLKKIKKKMKTKFSNIFVLDDLFI